MAALTRTPELQIAEAEAKLIADASAELLSHYGGDIDPRAVAWANFTMALGSVYGPRVIAIAIRAQNKKRAQANATAS